MSANKSAPKGLDRYVVVAKERVEAGGKVGVKEFYAFGKTQREAKELAKRFGISAAHVRQIASGKNWLAKGGGNG